MKKAFLFSLLLLVIIGSCTKEKESPLKGAWKLAYEYTESGGKLTTIYPGTFTGSEIKMWSEHNFIFVGRFKQDSTFTDSFGGGTYKLEGNRYEETVEYHISPDYLGKKVKLLLELKSDTIIQSWPVDDNGRLAKSEYSIEKWVRIK